MIEQMLVAIAVGMAFLIAGAVVAEIESRAAIVELMSSAGCGPFDDEPDDDDDDFDDDELGEAEMDCGRYGAGDTCALIGTEFCDFECPFRKYLG